MYCTIECLFKKKSDCKLTVYPSEDLYLNKDGSKRTDKLIEHNNIVIKKLNFSNKECNVKFFFEFSDNYYNYYLISYQNRSYYPYSIKSNIVKMDKTNKSYYFTNLGTKEDDKKIKDILLKKIYGDNYLLLIKNEIEKFYNYLDSLNNTNEANYFKSLKKINKYESKDIENKVNYYFDIFIDKNDILKISYKVCFNYKHCIIISKDIFNLELNFTIQNEPECIIYIDDQRNNYYLKRENEVYSIAKSSKFCFNELKLEYYLQFKELNDEVNQINQLNIEHTELIKEYIKMQETLTTTKKQEEPNYKVKNLSLKELDWKLAVYLRTNRYQEENKKNEKNDNILIKTLSFPGKDWAVIFFFKFSDNDCDYYLMSYQYNMSAGYGVKSNIVKMDKKNKSYYFTNLKTREDDKKIKDILLKKIYGDNYLLLIKNEIEKFYNYLDSLNNTNEANYFKSLKKINKYESKDIENEANYYFDIFIDEKYILKISYKVCFNYKHYIIISKDIFNLKLNSTIQNEPECIIYIDNWGNDYYLKRENELYSIAESSQFCFNGEVANPYLKLSNLDKELSEKNQFNAEHIELIEEYIKMQKTPITTKNVNSCINTNNIEFIKEFIAKELTKEFIEKKLTRKNKKSLNLNKEKSNDMFIGIGIFILILLLISSFLIFKGKKDLNMNKNEENISIEK